MHIHETILCSSAPPTDASAKSLGAGTFSLYDISTGSSIASFKQTNAASRCAQVLPTVGDVGGLLFAAQSDKSVLNVYNFQKDQIAVKMVLPEKLSCIAVDREGRYFAGGTVQGRVYLWEIASGILFNAWDAHYRRVSVLRFTNDGSALLSGSEDAGVNVWSIPRLLDNDTQADVPTPYCTLSDHTLPVTDIQVGIGSFPNCRVFTSSADHTVKIWDLATRSLLTTFQLPAPPEHLALDPTERLFFAAAGADVYQVNLFSPRLGNATHEMEALGGKGTLGETVRLADIPDARKRKISVSAPVSSLALSLTSALLLVGTTRAQIHAYDVRSHQLLRTISVGSAPAPEAPAHAVTYLAVLLRPSDLVGHVRLGDRSGGGGAGVAESTVFPRHVVPFHRTRDARAREAHEVGIILPPKARSTPANAYDREEMLRDHAFFTKPTTADSGAGAVASTARVQELEDEVARLREQLSKAKGVNDAMWETVVRKVVTTSTDEGEGPRRKKGKA